MYNDHLVYKVVIWVFSGISLNREGSFNCDWKLIMCYFHMYDHLEGTIMILYLNV